MQPSRVSAAGAAASGGNEPGASAMAVADGGKWPKVAKHIAQRRGGCTDDALRRKLRFSGWRQRHDRT